jgi:hypothetical protein
VIRHLQAYFLSPESAKRLGVTRIAFYAWFAFQVCAYTPWQFGRLPESLWDPVLLVGAMSPPSEQLLLGLSALLIASSLLACVGAFTRIATWITFLLGVCVFGAISSYGHVNIHFPPMIFLSCILACSRCGDAVSIDANRKPPVPRISADYGWPLRLGQVVFIGLMFTAGYQKLLGNWLVQPIHNMEYFLKYKYFIQAKLKGIDLPEVVLTASEQPWLLAIMALGMLCEALIPLALITRWPTLRFGLVGALFLMQLGLAVVLKTLPSFPWLGAYFFFVPWNRLTRFFESQDDENANLPEP